MHMWHPSRENNCIKAFVDGEGDLWSKKLTEGYFLLVFGARLQVLKLKLPLDLLNEFNIRLTLVFKLVVFRTKDLTLVIS